MKLWLDDDRPAPEGWVWVKTADAAIRVLEHWKRNPDSPNCSIEVMSFDHDLADEHYAYYLLSEDHPQYEMIKRAATKEMTGYDVLLWMVEHEVWPTETCCVHTHNSVRGPVMADMINRYGPYDHRIKWTPYRPSVEEVQSLMIEPQRYVLGDDLPGSY